MNVGDLQHQLSYKKHLKHAHFNFKKYDPFSKLLYVVTN